jgi:hypothetical protein
MAIWTAAHDSIRAFFVAFARILQCVRAFGESVLGGMLTVSRSASATHACCPLE